MKTCHEKMYFARSCKSKYIYVYFVPLWQSLSLRCLRAHQILICISPVLQIWFSILSEKRSEYKPSIQFGIVASFPEQFLTIENLRESTKYVYCLELYISALKCRSGTKQSIFCNKKAVLISRQRSSQLGFSRSNIECSPAFILCLHTPAFIAKFKFQMTTEQWRPK